MKRVLLISVLISSMFSSVAIASNYDEFENPPSDVPHNTAKSSISFPDLSLSGGIGLNNGTVGYIFGLTKYYKSGTEIGGVLFIGEDAKSIGVTGSKNLKFGWIVIGFHGGFDLGEVVTGSEYGILYSSSFWGYKNALMFNYGAHAGVELPFGFGARVNLGVTHILAHSDYTQISGYDDDPAPDNNDRVLAKINFEIYYKF